MARSARVTKVVARLFAWLGVGVLTFVAAAFVGGSLPSNRGWRPPAAGVTIWVEANAIHTGLVMPKVAAGVDWGRFARAADLADPRFAGYDHVAIGWGEKGFYLGTPTWRELRLRTVLGALAGSDETLLHVEHRPAPRAGPGDDGDERPVVLTPAQYRRLAAFVIASARPGGRRYRGYGPNDAFYQARGRFDLVRTCNSWTGDALRQAGIRIGRWTPLPVTVTGWF